MADKYTKLQTRQEMEADEAIMDEEYFDEDNYEEETEVKDGKVKTFFKLASKNSEDDDLYLPDLSDDPEYDDPELVALEEMEATADTDTE